METDSTGTVTRTFGQLPFGETWYETGAPDKWKFTTYERDSESGLDYAMNRLYTSGFGRFQTPDLLAGRQANPQSLNRYAYANNDPINFVDPLGLDENAPWQCVGNVCTIGSTSSSVDVFGTPGRMGGGAGGGGADTGIPLIFVGGKGRGGDKPIDKLPDAIRRALDALTNPDCASAVGSGMKDGKPVSAADVLNDLSTNVQAQNNGVDDTTHYGKITFEGMRSPDGTVISAVTGSASFSSNGGPAAVFVTMKINTTSGSFVDGSLQDQAVTLLHELGHAMGFLFGTNASPIKLDSELSPQGRAQSKANTDLIKKKCFSKKKK